MFQIQHSYLSACICIDIIISFYRLGLKIKTYDFCRFRLLRSKWKAEYLIWSRSEKSWWLQHDPDASFDILGKARRSEITHSTFDGSPFVSTSRSWRPCPLRIGACSCPRLRIRRSSEVTQSSSTMDAPLCLLRQRSPLTRMWEF